MQTGQKAVEVNKARGNTINSTFEVIQVLNLPVCIRQYLRNMCEILPIMSTHDNVKDGLLRHTENAFQGFRLRIAGIRNLAAGIDQPAQCGLFIHNLHIRPRIDRMGNTAHQLKKIRVPAYALQRTALCKLCRERHQITGLAGDGECTHGIIDFPMCRLIKIILLEQFKPKNQGLMISHHRTKGAALSIYTAGWYLDYGIIQFVSLPVYVLRQLLSLRAAHAVLF